MPRGDFEYTKSKPLNDHTQFNFRRYRRKYYGHVPGNTNPDLKKLGGVRRAEFVDGVTVVWIATDPDSRGRVIVGWYRDARVWGERQECAGALARERTTTEGESCGFSVEAPVATSRLMDPGKRPPLPIHGRSRKGKPGQNPYWYGNPSVNRRVLKMIAGGRSSGGGSSRHNVASNVGYSGWLQDTRERQEVEDNAMIRVMKEYSENGYDVEDVSARKLGYDVRAASRVGELHLEVKGSKGVAMSIELTPNEFSFAKKDCDAFRLCVVLDALSKHPKLRVFRPEPGGLRWCDESGNTVCATEKVGAVIRE